MRGRCCGRGAAVKAGRRGNRGTAGEAGLGEVLSLVQLRAIGAVLGGVGQEVFGP
jgi:hypothetical protein